MTTEQLEARREIAAALAGGPPKQGARTLPEQPALERWNAFLGLVLYPVPLEPVDEPGDY